MEFKLAEGHLLAVPALRDGIVVITTDEGRFRPVDSISMDGVAEADQDEARKGNFSALRKYIEVDPDGAQRFIGCVGRASIPIDHSGSSLFARVDHFREYGLVVPNTEL
jgi:hypothetical protein